MTRCHCGRRGLYAGACYAHATGMGRHRSAASRKGAKTAKAARGALCGSRLHAMTPANSVRKDGGVRCRACLAAARMRYQKAHRVKAEPRPVVAPYVPKRPRFIPLPPALLAEAQAEYHRWLEVA